MIEVFRVCLGVFLGVVLGDIVCKQIDRHDEKKRNK